MGRGEGEVGDTKVNDVNDTKLNLKIYTHEYKPLPKVRLEKKGEKILIMVKG